MLFVFSPMNILDLIAILPFYIEVVADDSSSLTFVRILRLFRVIRLLKISIHGGQHRQDLLLRVLLLVDVFRKSLWHWSLVLYTHFS